MSSYIHSLRRCAVIALVTASYVSFAFAQPGSAQLRGQVVDELGAVVVGAVVTVMGADGAEKTVITDKEGAFVFTHLAPGQYTIRVRAPGFAAYEDATVAVTAARREPLHIMLRVAAVTEQVEVASGGTTISVDPESNVGAVVLRGRDLESLPEDPDELAAALQALAGPSAGPSGGQIYIDGFTGGRLPSRDAIREIRINQNPFSAEFDRLGFGRIEILTRPGSETFHGQFSFNFNDESLNSRNPFAPTRAPHQARTFDIDFNGPIKKNKASFFLDVDRRDTDDNAVINAIVLDPALNIVPFSQAVLTPSDRTSFSPRVDVQLNDKHTLIARYDFFSTRRNNEGVGDFSLLSRAYDTTNTEHSWRVTETAILSARAVNETRFQYSRSRRRLDGDNTVPTINVLQSFIGGGAQVGQSFTKEDRWELHNITTWVLGSHALKFGGRWRGVHLTDVSEAGFGGTFTFSGQVATPTQPAISSIEQYRQKLLGNPDPRFNPNQFSITIGDPLARVTQVDFGGFVTDDWRARPNLTLSFGLRYEIQNNISSHFDFAPRLSLAWSPGTSSSGRSQTVVRAGFGIFYDRFSESFTLQADRFDGLKQQQFVVRPDPNNPATIAILSQPQFTLEGVTNVPTAEQIRAAVPGSVTIRRVDPGLQSPYTMQGAISVERQLPYNITAAVTYVATRTLHLLRSRNINAPLGLGLPRPDPSQGNIYQYEASGILNQHQLLVNVRANINPNLTFFSTYVLNRARSDTDGAGTFPAFSYDLSTEYGRSALDVRHRFFLGGSLGLPWNLRLNPFLVASSGRPFNIITGSDSNGDLQFTERPALATDLTRPSVRLTRFGAFDLAPLPGQPIIPRNYGTGPAFFNLNLTLTKTFGFGGGKSSEAAANPAPRRQQPGAGGPPPFGGVGGPRDGGGQRGFGGGMFGGASLTEKPYNLTLLIRAQNLLNRNNPGLPIGNLSSPLFGQPNSSAGFFGFFGGGGGGSNASTGNRRIELGVRFTF